MVQYTQEVYSAQKAQELLKTHKEQAAQQAQKGKKDMMTEQAAAARRAYKNAWAKANPDKVKAQQERYWQRQADRAAQAESSAPSADQRQPGVQSVI